MANLNKESVPTLEEIQAIYEDVLRYEASRKGSTSKGQGEFFKRFRKAESQEKNPIIENELIKKYRNYLKSEQDKYKKLIDDIENYGLKREEVDLFNYYVNKTKAHREEMKDFWKKLIGSAKKEVSVEKNRQAKGKLNVNDLIYSYPEFVEAEKKGNYKNLKIFDKSFLESQDKLLPEHIEISFLIDNSGSMDKEKIEATRKTLAVTLLSLNEFNEYLQIQAQKTNQKIDLLTETWFFGKDHVKVKSFEDTKDLGASKIISSITKIDGTYGTTDDASCLREIYNSISPNQKIQIKNRKNYKIIFIITDGASTFPGATKDILKKLIQADVEIYAIQIGKISKIDTKTFNYIWNNNFKYSRGLILGEDV